MKRLSRLEDCIIIAKRHLGAGNVRGVDIEEDDDEDEGSDPEF